MEFLELVKRRQSVRSYSEKAVEREKIERCLEAAQLSPSASNSQPWYFIVVDEPELRRSVANETFGKLISFNHFTLKAPVLVVVITEKSSKKAQIGELLKNMEYNINDVGIATAHFCLQAAEEGLGTCILGWFNANPIKKILSIPKKKKIGVIIALGYPADDRIRDKKRKGLDEIREYNGYSKQ